LAAQPTRAVCPGLGPEASAAEQALCWFKSDERGDAACRGGVKDPAGSEASDGATDEREDATSDEQQGETPNSSAAVNPCIENAVAWCADAALDDQAVADACSQARVRAGGGGRAVEEPDGTETEATAPPEPEGKIEQAPDYATAEQGGISASADDTPIETEIATDAPTKTERKGVSVPGLILTGVGAAGIITGGVLFAVAASQSADLADAEPGTPWTDRMQNDHDGVTTLRVGGGVAMQAGALLVGVGVVLLLGYASDEDDTETSRLEVSPLGRGVDLKWRF
jgi:hypothetical protein